MIISPQLWNSDVYCNIVEYVGLDALLITSIEIMSTDMGNLGWAKFLLCKN